MMTFNHGLSGYVCGQVAMPLLRRRAPVPERALGWAFFLGAMAPDLDILTRALLGRSAFFSGAWYAHRAASHSLLGTLVLGLVVAAVLYGPFVWRAAAGSMHRRAAFLWLAGCGWVGGLLHLLGDLFTPRWPMPIFWPAEVRYGALSHIGWFSPYLLWLFATAIALGWLGRGLLPRVERLREWAPRVVWAVYLLAAYRWVDYLVDSRYEHSAQWLAYQQGLLPDSLIAPITHGVRTLWLWFTG